MTRKELKTKNLKEIFVLLNNLQKIGNTPVRKGLCNHLLIRVDKVTEVTKRMREFLHVEVDLSPIMSYINDSVE